MTPTQELVMEVLVARWRLGDRLWTFSARQARVLRELEGMGLVSMMHGTVERTVRASLTERGREEWVLEGYTPPALAAEYNRGRRDLAVYLKDLDQAIRTTP